MIVDTSVLVAVLLQEPEVPDLVLALKGAAKRSFSAGNAIELSTVIARRFTPEMFGRADRLISTLGIEIVPVTVAQVALGRDAYRRFGRGSGSPAKLNFGDCFAYALAMERDEPLLFQGNDFIHTDVKRRSRS